MKIAFYSDSRIMECSVKDVVRDISASCIVRNELNRQRALHDPKQVVNAMVDDRYNKYPYMPREFPAGNWTIHAPVKRNTKYLAPFFIPTNAEQLVDVWALDHTGGYSHNTHEKVLDEGYGIHFSESITTLGCIRIHKRADLIWLVNMLNEEEERGRKNVLSV